jgi:glycosyltransferase involved in cell wall biosynthesis
MAEDIMTAPSRRWVITTTLNNAILRGAFTPFLEAFPDLDVVLVTDQIGAPMERVTYVVPSRWSVKLFGRLLPRWLKLFPQCAKRNVERVMVYNAVPHLLLAWWPAKLFGKPLDLAMIAGILDLDYTRWPGMSGNRVISRLTNPRHARLFERFFQWLAFKHVDRFFVTGSKAKQWLIEKGIVADHIFATPGCAHTEKFKPQNVPRDTDVVIVASFLPRKRPFLTLQILEQVLNARPQSKFIWLGDGPLREDVRAAVAASPLKNALSLAGFTEDMPGFYARAKIFLLNSVSEGLSGAAMEAMAAGCVPVTSDVGDQRDIVRTGETGVLISDHDRPEPYVEAILNLLENEPLRAELAVRARDLIVAEHSYDARREDWKRFVFTSS